MLRKFAAALLHLTMLVIVCAIAAYWAVRIMTPPPVSAPPPQVGAAAREADPVLAARMFGLVQAAPVQVASNVQAIGAFAAGKDSAAVLAVDGKPARVYLLNQEVANGAKLVAVRKDAVTIEQSGVRRDIALPAQEMLNVGGSPPAPAFKREGNTLTAPTVDAATPPAGTGLRPLLPRPAVMPQPLPQPLPSPAVPAPTQAEQSQQQMPQPPQVFPAQPQPIPQAESAQPGGHVRRAVPNRPLSQ